MKNFIIILIGCLVIYGLIALPVILSFLQHNAWWLVLFVPIMAFFSAIVYNHD